MSKFLHDDDNDDTAADDTRAMTIPRHFLQKQPNLKLSSNTPSYLELWIVSSVISQTTDGKMERYRTDYRWKGTEKSKMLIKYSFSSEPLLHCAYVYVFIVYNIGRLTIKPWLP